MAINQMTNLTWMLKFEKKKKKKKNLNWENKKTIHPKC